MREVVGRGYEQQPLLLEARCCGARCKPGPLHFCSVGDYNRAMSTHQTPEATVKVYLRRVIADIDASGLTLSEVCRESGLNLSVVSRWKNPDYPYEPRLSSIEKLEGALRRLKARKA